MTFTLKVRRIGGSLGAILPRELLDRMHLEEGAELHAVETEDGVLLTPYDPNFDAAMAAFDEVRKQYRNTLRKLGE